MSVIKKRVACDWPGCPAELEIDSFYPGVFRDHYWVESESGCEHLCSKHRLHSFKEMHDLIEQAHETREIS